MHQNYNSNIWRCESVLSEYPPPTRRIHTLTVCFLKHDNYFTHTALGNVHWSVFGRDYDEWVKSRVENIVDKIWSSLMPHVIIIIIMYCNCKNSPSCTQCMCAGRSPRKMLHSNSNNLKFMSSVNSIQVIRHVSFMT